MVGKPHLYKKYGYWNCNWNGIRGSGHTMEDALESLLKSMRFWAMENVT